MQFYFKTAPEAVPLLWPWRQAHLLQEKIHTGRAIKFGVRDS